MNHKLTFRRLRLVNIIIKLTKEDINNGNIFIGGYNPKLSLRMLRSIVDLKEYNDARKNRLDFLRTHYMDKIKEVYEN